MPLEQSPFDLPDALDRKSDPALIADDERQFAAIATSLAESVADLEERLASARLDTSRHSQAALDRDEEIHRLTSRLRVLRRFRLDLCLGRMVKDDDPAPVYVGRFGLTSGDGTRLLVDWRSPAAEPFFAATHAQPMGLTSRRRYRWTLGRITDYWDEVFTVDGLEGHAALDDQSAFIASLGGSRSTQMRDVLGTIQADQDAIIRAGSRGALVVDGGPGTGKTVVALHRTAYLLYADPRLGHRRSGRRGGVLFVGPHQPYLSYVGDVLPSLGEEGVQTTTLRSLVPQGATARIESDPQVAALKASLDLVRAIEPAVALYEEPPTSAVIVETPWGDARLRSRDWSDAFAAPDPGTPHNEAREQIWEELAVLVGAQLADDQTEEREFTDDDLLRTVRANATLVDLLGGSWPILQATDLVADLWSVPAYLRHCAPGLSAEEVRKLQRGDPQAWTVSDLPLLDAARQRLGDPEISRRRRRQEDAVAAQREQLAVVIDDLIAADDSELLLMTSLRQQGLSDALVDEGALPSADPDLLDGPFAHIVVDEAQELTDAEWQMLLARCPSRSLTIVGDRAQARHGFHESWQTRLARVGLDQVEVATLSVNYRTPAEVMAHAEPVIRAQLPDANVPTSVRSSGIPVRHESLDARDRVIESWLAEHPDGIASLIGPEADVQISAVVGSERVRSLTPELAKGLEFDLVVLSDPDSWGDGIEGAVDRYVAMTRATQQLVLLSSAPDQ